MKQRENPKITEDSLIALSKWATAQALKTMRTAMTASEKRASDAEDSETRFEHEREAGKASSGYGKRLQALALGAYLYGKQGRETTAISKRQVDTTDCVAFEIEGKAYIVKQEALTDGAELIHEAAAALWEYAGQAVHAVIGQSKTGKDVTPFRMACRAVARYVYAQGQGRGRKAQYYQVELSQRIEGPETAAISAEREYMEREAIAAFCTEHGIEGKARTIAEKLSGGLTQEATAREAGISHQAVSQHVAGMRRRLTSWALAEGIIAE